MTPKAVFPLRLLLIVCFLCNVFGSEQIYQGKNVQQSECITQDNLEDEKEFHMVIMAMVNEIIQMNLESKMNQEKMAKTQSEFLTNIKDLQLQVGHIKTTFETAQTKLQEIPSKTKDHDCPKLAQSVNAQKNNSFCVAGKHFYFNTTKMNWLKARDWCVALGMHLASLKTSIEVEATEKQLRRYFDHYSGSSNFMFWLSASDINRTHGQFEWLDGTPVEISLRDTTSLTSWPNKPNSYGASNATCVLLITNTISNTLYDYLCETGDFFPLCEVPSTLFSCL